MILQHIYFFKMFTSQCIHLFSFEGLYGKEKKIPSSKKNAGKMDKETEKL